MIGVPYNPDNCAFLSNQALNANQFNPNVPDSDNSTNHTVLWDFIEKKIYWVNTITNIIEKEFPSGSGNQNELYSNYTGYESTFTIEQAPKVPNNNFILLPAGTYNFELEFDVRSGTKDQNDTPVYAEIRTNVNPAIDEPDLTDVVQSSRYIGALAKILEEGAPNSIYNQNVCKNNVTFNAPFIVKSVFYCPSNEDNDSKPIGRVFLRALKVK